MTRSSGSEQISPVKGWSWESINKIDAATPAAKIPIVMVEASRLSLWTMPIASRAQAACTNRHDHSTKLTCDDDDALPTRIERSFKRSGDLALCCFLAFGLWR